MSAGYDEKSIADVYQENQELRRRLEAAEKRLRNSLFFGELVESIPHPVFCKDKTARFTYGNEAYCRMQGISCNELIGLDDFALHPREAAEKYRANDQTVIETETVFTCEEEHVRLKGDKRYIQVVKAPMYDNGGRVCGIMGMFWDITNRKQIELELREAGETLEARILERTAELREANCKLQDLNAQKSAFLSSASHELRTPLTSIMGFARLINRDAGKVSERQAVHGANEKKLCTRIMENSGIIFMESERLARLVDDLLDLNRIEVGKMGWNDSRIDLAEIVGESFRSIKGQVSDNFSLEFEFIAPEQPLFVKADPDKIKQLLINLLNNSLKFTKSGFVRAVVQKISNSHGEILVQDTGKGIPENDVDHIFEKYYQCLATRGNTKGAGLGLAICKQIVDHYKGSIRAESEQGKGTTISVRLPLSA